METLQEKKYLELMKVIRNRFDSIEYLTRENFDHFNNNEIAAFHGRKIIEAIAFSCLVATKNGFNHIPKDAQGQYNAEKILKNLSNKGIEILPSPSEIRYSTNEEQILHNTKITINGILSKRISKEELIKKYQRMYNWLHELNPYTREGQKQFNENNQNTLLKDLSELKGFLASHLIGINGKSFFVLYGIKLITVQK